MDIEKIVAVYVKIRDEKSRVKQEADKRCAELQAKLARLEAEIQRELNRLNVQSVRTGSGTAFQKLRSSRAARTGGCWMPGRKPRGFPRRKYLRSDYRGNL